MPLERERHDQPKHQEVIVVEEAIINNCRKVVRAPYSVVLNSVYESALKRKISIVFFSLSPG